MAALLDEGRKLLVRLGGGAGQRMVGGDGHEFRAKQRVGPRREDLDLARLAERRGQGEAQQQALRAADPIVLHEPHFFRPALQRLEAREQLLGVIGDLEEPLRQLALLDERAGAPAAPVDDLLIGEHGVVDRVPVHLGLLAVDDSGLQKIQEELLLAAVIGGIAGRDLARPVEREAERFELRLHRRDIGVGPFGRMALARHGGVLGGKAEGVPAHGMQNVESPRAHEAGDDVAHRIIAHMPHVDAPRRIGEHLQHIIFGMVWDSARPRKPAPRPRPCAIWARRRRNYSDRVSWARRGAGEWECGCNAGRAAGCQSMGA